MRHLRPSAQYSAHLYIRIDAALRARLLAAANASGLTISDAARQGLQLGLGCLDAPGPVAKGVKKAGRHAQ